MLKGDVVFLVADPRIVPDPKPIKYITYRELRELSYMGASVLHEDAIFPVRSCGIPINIKNTNAPEDAGTWIVESTCQKQDYVVTGIAGKKDFCTIFITKAMMNSEIGFCRKVLQAFEENNISFEHMPSGIDTSVQFSYTSARLALATIEPVTSEPPREKVLTFPSLPIP